MKKKLTITYVELAYEIMLVAFLVSISTLTSVEWFASLHIKLCLELLGLFFLAVKIVRSKYSIRQAWVLLVVGLLFFISFYNTGDEMFVISYLVILASNNIEFDQLVKKDLKIRLIFMSLVAALSSFGLIWNRTERRLESGKIRMSLGFSHPNNLGAMFFCLALYYFYLKHRKFSIKDYGLLIVLAILCFTITDSRTTTALILGIVLLEILDTVYSKINFANETKYRLLSVLQSMIVLCPLVSFYVAFNYNYKNPVYLALNSLFNSRLYLANAALKNVGLSLVGQKVDYVSWVDAKAGMTTNAIDNLYVYIGVNFGIVTLVVVLLMLLFVYRYALKNNNRSVCLCLLIIMIMGFFENKVMYIGENIFLLYFAQAFFELNNGFQTTDGRE